MKSVKILEIGKLFRKKSFRILVTCVNILDIGKLFRNKFFQDIGDKRIEVVGLENCLHMGQVGDNAWMMDEWCFG